MRAELANLNHCAVPFLSRATVDLVGTNSNIHHSFFSRMSFDRMMLLVVVISHHVFEGGTTTTDYENYQEYMDSKSSKATSILAPENIGNVNMNFK